jgi:hypothetical protein
MTTQTRSAAEGLQNLLTAKQARLLGDLLPQAASVADQIDAVLDVQATESQLRASSALESGGRVPNSAVASPLDVHGRTVAQDLRRLVRLAS